MIADSLAGQVTPDVVAAGVIAVGGALAAGLVRYGRRMKKALERVENQVTPNGGQGDNLGDRARRTEETVARMEGRLLDHENRLTAHALQLATNLEQLARNSTQLDHIEQQIAQAPAPSVTVNTTTSTSPQQARRTPLPPPPPGVNE